MVPHSNLLKPPSFLNPQLFSVFHLQLWKYIALELNKLCIFKYGVSSINCIQKLDKQRNLKKKDHSKKVIKSNT